ncbi:hypothetical protein AYR54_03710 [Loigolactobacillus backii]|uniref:TetR/AcrR family transcriptional regulator n=1 Tax=Loigolactobacillus backii TaxID=375175 RepID=UPI0007F1375F|nr:TetR/AcrR family transcriptional regulator [Loigolactobacillus backii]ANK59424.1 hypothetical protein AYR52_03700 [Loigolactobacillus backii]ANK64417.1 hypothetical protein AYR54_03710 [Loigolactobacillus backii]ANK67188.1 hypothetical protein AYR55_05330 [Loigolactobacillus backii]OLF69448.1 hypothetical protein ACX53_08035 [Loigolactobacillus backii]PIO87832.1 TetR family transcriptional regulator [Loigolactobacillus backii]
MAEIKRPTRRRGKELENELLKAAWTEFKAKGYDQLTMEGVAACAHTTKTVLYRRWPKKSLLLIAAFKKFGPRIESPDTDTGSLREDLFNLLGAPLKSFAALGEATVRGLVADQIGQQIGDVFGLVTSNTGTRKYVVAILKQADQRGDIKLVNLSERAINLPAMLLLDEILATGFLTQAGLYAMIDEILMPVLLASKQEKSN